MGHIFKTYSDIKLHFHIQVHLKTKWTYVIHILDLKTKGIEDYAGVANA